MTELTYTGYETDEPGFEYRHEKTIVFFSTTSQADSEINLFNGNWEGPFLGGVKRPGHDVDPSPPSSVKVTNQRSYSSAHGVGRDNCTFTYLLLHNIQ
jgi:hypothetical protein